MSEEAEQDPGPAAQGSTDFFYHGTIQRLQLGRGSGLVVSGNGREIRFQTPFVDFLNFRRLEELREGMLVGFDVGWTSKGLRVTKLKIY